MNLNEFKNFVKTPWKNGHKLLKGYKLPQFGPNGFQMCPREGEWPDFGVSVLHADEKVDCALKLIIGLDHIITYLSGHHCSALNYNEEPVLPPGAWS